MTREPVRLCPYLNKNRRWCKQPIVPGQAACRHHLGWPEPNYPAEWIAVADEAENRR